MPRELADLHAGTVKATAGDLVSVSFPTGSLGPNSDVLRRKDLTVSWADEDGVHECPATAVQVQRDSVVLRRRFAEQREAFRVEVRLPLRFAILPDEAIEKGPAVAGRADSLVSADHPSWTRTMDAVREATSRGQSAIAAAEGGSSRQPWDADLNLVRRDLRAVEEKLDRLLEMVQARGDPAGAAPVVRTRLSNLSAAGIAFRHDSPIATGTRMRLWIETERGGAGEIGAVGMVVHCGRLRSGPDRGRFEIGVKFESIHAVDRERIFRLVARVEQNLLQDPPETTL